MSGRMRDLIIGLGTAGFFAVMWLAVIPTQIRVPSRVAVAALSPAFWPTTVAICGIVLGLVIAGRAMANLSIDDDDEDPDGSGEREEWRSLLSIGLMFGYLGLIHVIGIMAASIVSLIALALLFGRQRLIVLLPVAVLLPVGLYYFFTRVVLIPLPLGIFERLFS